VIKGSAGTTGTDGADTFTSVNTAASATYGSGDVIVGGAGADVLNITADNKVLTAATSVVGIETINVTAIGSGITDSSSFDAGGVVALGSTINVSNKQVTNSTGFTITALGTGATVAADSTVTGTLSVTTAASTSQTVTLAANSAGTQTLVLTGTTGTTDVATVAAVGTVGTNTAGGNQIETVNFSGNSAAVSYTISGTATTYNLTGTQNVTLSGNESSFDGKTITDNTTAGTTTLEITTSAQSDLSKAAVDLVNINVASGAAAYTFRDGQAVKVSKASTADLTFDIDDQVATNYKNGSITVELIEKATAGNGIVVTATSATSDNISTLNLVNNTIAQTDLELTATVDTAVVLSGSKAVALEDDSTAKSVTQTGSGALTVIYDNVSDISVVTGGSGADTFTNSTTAIGTEVTINGGGGNDTFTMLTAAKAVIDGGDGNDKLILDGTINAANLKLSNLEVIALTGTAVTDFKASQLSGKTYIITGDAVADTIEINDANSIDTLTIDLSGLVLDTTNITAIKVDGSAITSAFGATAAQTFTGSSTGDAYIGSQGADTITGGNGADTITSGLGSDTIILTETTAARDTIVSTVGAAYTTAAADKITGFTFGDTKDIFQVDISDSTDIASVGVVTAGNGATAIAGNLEIKEVVVGTGATLDATSELVVMTGGTFADAAALKAAITSDGSVSTSDIAWSTAPTATNAFLLFYSDGTTGHLVTVADAKVAANATLEAADVSIVELATFMGVTSVTAGMIHTTNFAAIA
jgi:hypothetical protein